MAKRNINQVEIDATTLRGQSGFATQRYHDVGGISEYVDRDDFCIRGFGTSSSIPEGLFLPNMSPGVMFSGVGPFRGRYVIYGNMENEWYMGREQTNIKKFRKIVFEDNLAGLLNNTLSIEDLKDVLSSEQITKLEAKVQKRIIDLKTSNLIINQDEMRGGG